MKTQKELKQDLDSLNGALSEEELKNVTGGVTTPEAEEWWERNSAEIIRRAPSFLKNKTGTALNYVRNSSDTYDIAACKAALKSFGVNVDDLD